MYLPVTSGAVLAFLVAAISPGARGADPPRAGEYQVKAAFLYNFAKFVEWPPEAFTSPSQPVGICVLGRDPFGTALDAAVSGKSFDGRTFAVRHLDAPGPTAGCHVLFAGAAEGKRTALFLESSRLSGVLLVGESGSAAAPWMAINFTLENGSVRFEVNLAGAERGKIGLSSRLLSLATHVRK